MAAIMLDGVDKVYANGVTAVRDLAMSIGDGELLVLVGPSGCGKSTVLRLIAGLESPSHGRILISGRDITVLPPQARNLAMVFQNYALYPHKTVRQNLAFGLIVRRAAAADIGARVQRVAATLGLDALLDRKPAELSGGQRQRVALGRAIVRDADAFLLDEPLSNLDPGLRADTRAELAVLHRQMGATMVYVTHDQEEAMTLGSRVAVMRAGAVEQLATPLEVYRQPSNVFVAGFVGSPAMNLLRCRCERTSDVLRIWFGGSWLCTPPVAGDPHAVWLGMRPHDVELASAEADATGNSEADATGKVEVIEQLGPSSVVHVRVDDSLIRVLVASETAVAVEDRVVLRVRREKIHLFDVDSGRRMDWRQESG